MQEMFKEWRHAGLGRTVNKQSGGGLERAGTCKRLREQDMRPLWNAVRHRGAEEGRVEIQPFPLAGRRERQLPTSMIYLFNL